MRIGIDIRKYSDYGIGTYLQNLISGLQGHSGSEFVYFASDEVRSAAGSSLQGRIVADNSPKYSIQELFSLSRSANASGLDLFHAPHYTLPFNLKMPSVVTVHDIIHLRMKEYFSPIQRMYARLMIGHACKGATAVIVVSEFTKRELMREFDVPEEKITVIYNGVHGSYFQPPDEPALRSFKQRYGITGPYILYTGSVKPHKNVSVLIKALAKLRKERPVQLVMTGEHSSLNQNLSRVIEQYHVRESVIETGRISESDLGSAYGSAEAVVLPSFYEGFGLSMIEAMASGVPAVGARTSSIEEIVGDAGLLFDPNDADELCRNLRSISEDTELRRDLHRKGKIRAAQFSWQHTVERTLNIYQKVCK